jgi:phosphonate transport system substrate-binding protein
MMKRRNFLRYSLLSLSLAGCTEVIGQNWYKDSPPKLSFTVTDVFGLEQLEENYGEFRLALAEVLGIEVVFFPVNNFIEAAPAFLANKLDFALAGPSEYIILRSRAQGVPVIALTRPHYYTIVSVRANSGITSLKQLKGKTIGMRSQGSTSSHLGMSQLLSDVGLEPQVDFKPVIVGDRGLEMLMEEKIDAWAEGSTRWRRFVAKEGLSERELAVIAQGKPLPNDIFVANANLGPQWIEKMRSLMLKNEQKLMRAILKAPANDKYQKSKLVPAHDRDYDVIRKFYKTIGQEEFIR